MDNDYSFLLDTNYRVVSWGKQLSHITGMKSSKTLGKTYHEVFPRLLSDQEDAVQLAMSSNKKVLLKGYPLECPFTSITADILIETVKEGENTAGKGAAGARVTISNIVCPVLKNIRNAQRFIDIGKTASTLAHGVRNPLSAVTGAVLYLNKKYPKEHMLAEFANIMDDEIRKFDNFISKFLSDSLFDEEPVITDINALLRKIQVMTSFQAHFYHIRTVYEYGDIPLVRVAPFQFEHAILNIINNALEVMRSGGRLTVQTRLETFSEGNFIVVEISDTGSGEFGDSVPQYTPLEGGGKGFGLLITREILRHYGGHLEINNRKGKGTTAILYIAADKKGETK